MSKLLFWCSLALLAAAVLGSAIPQEEEEQLVFEEEQLEDDHEHHLEKRQSIKGTKKAPVKKVTCQTMNLAPLSGCCKNPLGPFFTNDEMIACNNKKREPPVFSWAQHITSNQAFSTAKKTFSFGNVNKAVTNGVTKGVCLLKCLYTNKGLLKEDGAVNYAAAKEFYTKLVSEKWSPWNDVFPAIFDSCVEKVEKTDKTTLKNCENGATLLHQCLLLQKIFNCPEEFRNDKVECKSRKSSLEKCMPGEGQKVALAVTTAAAPAAAPAKSDY